MLAAQSMVADLRSRIGAAQPPHSGEVLAVLDRLSVEIERFAAGQHVPPAPTLEPEFADLESLDESERTSAQVRAYLAHAGDFAQLIVDHSLDMIIAVDLMLRIVEFNPAAQRAFGYEKADVIGKSVEILYADPTEAWPIRSDSFRNGYLGEVRNRRRDGSCFWARLTSVSLLGPDGDVMGVVGISRDITAQRDAAAALRQRSLDLEEAHRRAEAATLAKSQFLANMSHEIRTPMTAILGYSEQLCDAAVNESERRFAAETIQRNGKYLLAIINDILDLSKIEAGRLPIEPISFAPAPLLDEVLALVAVQAAAKGVRLESSAERSLPGAVCTDPLRLRQILINLIANAIKFTEVGGVRVVASVAPSTHDSHAGVLQFDIIDDGIGMTPEQSSQLFEAFTQADSSTARRYGGTGLGLTIAKRLAQLMGGDVCIVRSMPGQGTHFRATVGFSAATSGMPSNVAQAGGALSTGRGPLPRLACRVLLVEDGPDNQRLISHVLTRAGATVTLAANGREGVDLVLASMLRRRRDDPPTEFDLIFMDMQMPVMDGYEATRELRARGFRGPIVALTAHALAGDRERCLNAGCNEFATKPIDRRSLVELASRFTAQLPRPPGPEASGSV